MWYGTCSECVQSLSPYCKLIFIYTVVPGRLLSRVVAQVGAVGTMPGKHGGSEHYMLSKNGHAFEIVAKDVADPPLGGLTAIPAYDGIEKPGMGASITVGVNIHPMPASYVPWLFPGGVYPTTTTTTVSN